LGSSAFLGALTVGRQLGYAGYMLCDNAAFLDQVGAWKSETGKVAARRASQFWLMGLACSAVGAGWQTVALRIKESEVRSGSANGEKGEEAVELKKIARYVIVEVTMAGMTGRTKDALPYSSSPSSLVLFGPDAHENLQPMCGGTPC